MTRKLIVCDIDGTIANNDHRNHWIATKPKNWKAFFAEQDKDTPYEDILWTLRQYEKDNHTIIFCTGRSEEHRNVTIMWLNAMPHRAASKRHLFCNS